MADRLIVRPLPYKGEKTLFRLNGNGIFAISEYKIFVIAYKKECTFVVHVCLYLEDNERNGRIILKQIKDKCAVVMDMIQ
jgi:hypothetical protein